MKMKKMRLFFSALVIAGAGNGVLAGDASDYDFGKREFRDKCAACHGVDAKGGGSVAASLNTAPTDLTMLRKNNGGVFPFERIYDIVDGRHLVKAHGDRDMPVWGSHYARAGLRAAADDAELPPTMEVYIRGRILALIDYLDRIQEK